MHPFYDDASQTLYFAANKTDGLGRFDIYSVPFDGTTFGEMKIIEGANSIMNDTYPFVIENELYFSSDRSGGLGGLDIYKRSSDNIVTNIGEPFNTTFDDFDISFIDENNGFFSSNRQLMMNAATDDDCYFFHYSDPFTQVVQTINLINDTTKNSELLRLSNDLLAAAKNNVYFNSTNASISTRVSESINNTNEVAQIEKEFASLVLAIYAAVDSVVFTNKSFVSKRLLTKIAQTNDLFLRAHYLDSLANSDLIVESNSHLKNLVAQAIAKNQALIQQIADAYISAPILFAFDSYELSQEYDTMLIEMAAFIKTNSAFQIFVDGHTDDSGKLSYNSELSKRRALAVERFLIKQGVKPTDFVVAYYGPEKPVATNDTREGRMLNRRVEIRLVPRI
jgi:outer membrane protein OmpA-like peptidoglycan-associated protein